MLNDAGVRVAAIFGRDRSGRARTSCRGVGTPRVGRAYANAFYSASLPAIAPSLYDAEPDERLLAGIRFAMAAGVLIWLLSDTGPGHSLEVEILTAVYGSYAGLLAVAARVQPARLLRHNVAIHWIDFGWTAIASTISGGTGSHIFPYFSFVLAGAAFRWGLRRALVDGALIIAVGVAQSVAAAKGLTPWAFEFDVFLVRVSGVACGMAALFGIFADRLHRARHQATAIAQLGGIVSRASRLSTAVADTLAGIVRLQCAAHVLLVVREAYTGGLSLWRADALPSGDITTMRTEIPATAAIDWMPADASTLTACELRRRAAGAAVETPFGGRGNADAARAWLPLPPAVLTAADWDRLLAIPFSASGAWTGQLYVMDPKARPRGELRLRFLTDSVREVIPGLLNLYLLRRLRSRAESLERNRISRELHDTIQQSLTGIEMRIDVLRRQTAGTSPALGMELTEIQALLRDQSLELRHLMDRLRSSDVDAQRLPGALGDLVARFARTAGIDARLEWAVARLDLPPHHCSEIVRIVQEALVNVRKHSGAGTVLVRIEEDADGWGLVVEDDGRGFGFRGRLTDEELEVRGVGPRVIRERVVALGGSLTIECDGITRLEMSFPLAGRYECRTSES